MVPGQGELRCRDRTRRGRRAHPRDHCLHRRAHRRLTRRTAPTLDRVHDRAAGPGCTDTDIGRTKVGVVSLEQGLFDLAVVSLIAALAPIVAGLLSRFRVPQVVILIVAGVVVGPQVLGWAEPQSIELISNVGLGFLFLLAGYELELELFRERAGRLAITSWLATALIAIAVTGALAAAGFVNAFVPIAIGLTTTALGTLLPILRDNHMLEGQFGAFIMAAGAVGEFLPIVAIAIFLSANGAFLGLLSLVVIGTIALLFTFVPKLARHKRIAGILSEGEHATSQT